MCSAILKLDICSNAIRLMCDVTLKVENTVNWGSLANDMGEKSLADADDQEDTCSNISLQGRIKGRK